VEDPRVRTKKFVHSINKGKKRKRKKKKPLFLGARQIYAPLPPSGLREVDALPAWLAAGAFTPRAPPSTGGDGTAAPACRCCSRQLTRIDCPPPARASATPPSLSHDWALPGLGFPLLARLAIQHDACSSPASCARAAHSNHHSHSN